MSPPFAPGWLAEVGADAVLRGQGADASRMRERQPRVVAVAERVALDGAKLLRPRAACRVIRIRAHDESGVTLEDGLRLTGALIAACLSGAVEVAVVVATLGTPLERRVSRMFGRDLPYAFALDAYGSAAVEALVRSATRHLRESARRAGAGITRPVGPGMEGFDLADGQREIFAVLGGETAGVTLLATGGMAPRKSVSLVFGLGPAAAERGGVCDPCSSRAACRFRSVHASGS